VPRDYAKRNQQRRKKKKTANRRKSTSRSGSTGGSTLRGYIAGLLSGFFISFLLYLATLPSGDTAATADRPTPQPQAQATEQEVIFEFYDQLQKQRVEVDATPVEPAADVRKPPQQSRAGVYLLQAVAFRQRDDADSRRAELIFLGLEPTIQETRSDGSRWYRVQLGPFETASAMNKARALTAAQGIETLPLKRPRN